MGKICLCLIAFDCFLALLESEVTGILTSIALPLGLIWGLRYLIISERAAIKNAEKEMNETMSTLGKFKIKYNLPVEVEPIKVLKSSKDIFYGQYYVWMEDNNLKLISYTPKYSPSILTININDILFFNRYGDSYMETNVSGGGSNIPGALIGGLVAGGVGAIIGSRKKVVTVNKYKDNRETVLYFKDLDSSEKNIIFSSDDYNTLMRLIPSKEYSLIMFKNK